MVGTALEDMELREGSDTEKAMEGEEKVVKVLGRDDAVGCFTQHTGESVGQCSLHGRRQCWCVNCAIV